jgi:hypothetical protein
MRTLCLVLALGSMATALLTGCGGDSDSEQTAGAEGNPASSALSPRAPLTEQLARVFPVPKAEPTDLPGAAKAIAAGRAACRGKTPVEVRDEFMAAAEAEAGLNEGQKEMLVEIARFEEQARHSPNFAAGQLAAGVYEATLPELKRMAGFRGCVYELALQLRHELAKSGKNSGNGKGG